MDSSALEGRPVYLIFAANTQALGSVPSNTPASIAAFLRRFAPSFTRHWGVRVENRVWELYKDENNIVDYAEHQWDAVSGRYGHEVFMGMTMSDDDDIHDLAEQIITSHLTYEAWGDNCQSFALNLVEAIPMTIVPETATSGITQRIYNYFKELMRAVAWFRANGRPPMQARDIMKRLKALLKILFDGAKQVVTGLIISVIDIICPEFFEMTGTAMAWFASLAEIFLEQGWVLLKNGASFFGASSMAICAVAATSLKGVINIAFVVAASPWTWGAAVVAMVSLGAWYLYKNWGERRSFSDEQLRSIALRVMQDNVQVVTRAANNRPRIIQFDL